MKSKNYPKWVLTVALLGLASVRLGAESLYLPKNSSTFVGLYQDHTGAARIQISLEVTDSQACDTLILNDRLQGNEASITVTGVRPLGGLCARAQVAMYGNPAPRVWAIATIRYNPGTYLLNIERDHQVDQFKLLVTSASAHLEPSRALKFTQLADSNAAINLMPPDAIWINLYWHPKDQWNKQREDFIKGLQALGAVPWTPPQGHYGYPSWPGDIPIQAGESDNREEWLFYHYPGDRKQMEQLITRFKKYKPKMDDEGHYFVIRFTALKGYFFWTDQHAHLEDEHTWE